MVHIRLFCNAGMSTSMLVKRMRRVAESNGAEVDIVAYSAPEAPQKMGEADVALIGPQISFRLEDMQKIGDQHGVPVEVIPMKEYGMCNGEAVLKQAMDLYEKKQG